MILIAILAVAVACAADTYTTIELIQRGGRERLTAWLVGEHPSPETCWFAYFIAPVALCTIALLNEPRLAWAVYGFAVLRALHALRNHKLQR